MTPTDQQGFTFLMMSIAELYGKKLSKPLLDIYWRCLEPYSLAQISTALRIHLLHPDHGQFMPKPADILRAIDGNTESQALQAWSKVLQAIRRVGSYESVVFDDPLIHLAIVDLGGWITLCRSDTKSLVWIGKQFEKIYCSYLQRKPTHYPKQLTGEFAHQNTRAGSLHEAVRLLGEKNKALQVLQMGCDPTDYTRQYVGIRFDGHQLAELIQESEKPPQFSEERINSLCVNSGDKNDED